MNYDAENLTKQSDADLHHMQEQTFAGETGEWEVMSSPGRGISGHQRHAGPSARDWNHYWSGSGSAGGECCERAVLE